MGRSSSFARHVIARDKVCQVCGSNEGLQAHHIILVSEGGSDELGNGTALCASCHADEHPAVPRALFFSQANGPTIAAKWNATSLAAGLGCCARTVVRAARRLGISRQGNKWAFVETQKQQIGRRIQPHIASKTIRLQVKIPSELYNAIQAQAFVELSTVSQVARRALRDVFLPDQATLERCLVDPGASYSTDGGE